MKTPPPPVRKLILRQGQSPGDILTFTRSISDLKQTYPHWQIDVRTPAPEIFENNPHLTPLDESDPAVETFTIGYSAINELHCRNIHFTDAFREDLEQKLGVPIETHCRQPEIWISDLEKSWINQAIVEFDYHGPFWLLNAGRKPDNELKMYHRWQEVVDMFNHRFAGDVRIIQVGHRDHIHPPLKGVLNLVGKTDLRQLIRLQYWAQGTVGPISFQMVLSAAFNQAAVCVMGGKEDPLWHCYPHIQYLWCNGALECCSFGGCWKGGQGKQCVDLVEEVPRCFHIIEPHTIVDAIERYYTGGRLTPRNTQ